ncbi:hypothetical protein KAU11_00345 [Candidatus Babeliales bacterium]|nr:hypothetical protein [Candidatus Babeliales bacterium]
MRTYEELFKKALDENRSRLNNLYAFKPVINAVNELAEEALKDPAFSSISCAYPTYGSDYLLVILYLAEKGSISKAGGIFIDELKDRIYLEQDSNVSEDGDKMMQSFRFTCPNISYYADYIRHPCIVVAVDASKSKVCRQVSTGEMVPVYKIVCDEEE